MMVGSIGRPLGIAAALLVLGSVGASAQVIAGAEASRIDAVFSRFTVAGSPGCALGVYRAGKTVYAKGYGSAHLEQEVAVKPSSIFQIGSVSKQFAAMALVLLEQDGKLSLDDDIHRFFPEVPTFGKTVTLRQMIQHTSGIRDGLYPLVWTGTRYPLDMITIADGLDIVSRQKRLEFDPGTDWSYSNTTYWLLGQVVKRASGKSLNQFTHDRIFVPLGMTKTSFHDQPTAIMRGGRTQAYEWQASDSTYQISVPIYDLVGAGGLYTTVEDLAAWDRNFTTGQVGGKAGIDAMHSRAVLASGDTLTYALGIAIGNYRGITTWGHGGADGGYRAHLLRVPEASLGVAVICNADNSGPERLLNNVLDIVLADLIKKREPAKVAPASVTLTEAQLATRVGFYRGDGELLKVSLVGGKLRSGLWNAGPVLTPLAENRFQVGENVNDVLTFRSEGGRNVVERPHQYRKGAVRRYVQGPEVRPGPAQLAEYAGSYWSDDLGTSFNMVVQGDSLVVERRKLAPASLTPTLKDVFLEEGARYLFERDGAGRITGFSIDIDRAHGIRFTRGR